MCVRAGQESREAVRSLRSVFCVWTASNCSIPCTQSSPPAPPYLPTSTNPGRPPHTHTDTHWNMDAARTFSDRKATDMLASLTAYFKTTTKFKLNIEHRSAHSQLNCVLPAPASGFVLLFSATGKLLPPTRHSTAVQSLQPFLTCYHAAFQTDSPLSNIFMVCGHLCVWQQSTCLPAVCPVVGRTPHRCRCWAKTWRVGGGMW